MAGYRIVKQPRAWWPVEWKGVDEDGDLVTNKIEMRFRVLKVDAATSFIRTVVEAQAREADGDRAQVYAELVAEIATDWRGVEAENGQALPFDVPDGWLDERDVDGKRKPLIAPNLRLLMNENGMFGHIFEAFRQCLAGAPKVRAGN